MPKMARERAGHTNARAGISFYYTLKNKCKINLFV